MKVCFKCGVAKDRSEFYAHPQMKDGLLGKCKACTKLDVRTHRASHDSVREYDRQRSTLPHRIALRKQISEQWRQRHGARWLAQTKARRAMVAGKIKQPEVCEGCGLRKRLEKHHPDYSKPVIVVWLCKPCHAIADKIRRRLEAS